MHPESSAPSPPPPRSPAGFLPVLAGVSAFLAFQYALALWRLSDMSGGMMNKFSRLAREEHMGFLIRENTRMLIAYAILALAGTFLIQPAVVWWTARSRHRAKPVVALRSLALAAALHGYCTLRLVDTRPYFLKDVDFGHWYYRILEIVPNALRTEIYWLLFTALPLLALLAALVWWIGRLGRKGRWIAASLTLLASSAWWIAAARTPETLAAHSTGTGLPNIIIIGSDSLRGDRLGFAGHRPTRQDGPAAAGVSPAIDALAARSIVFERCYTPIASTMESGVSLMASQYPHTHGLRQMYPDRATVDATNRNTRTLAALLREKGYETAAIGDWCAGYYQVLPLGMEDISVSSFDNFRIYMSQAVVMAHFIIPLFFDHPVGYRLFPELGSFAQFVTPEVVTRRVENRLERAGKTSRPFFWHVFYSCNHLPYRSPEPYCSMFADPSYNGKNRNGVDFDIDAFIGGTDLESKWQALPPHEVEQIRALYDGCTRQFDECVRRILDAIERNGLAGNTIVIVTSDHGDDLYEPGVTLGHGLTFNGGLQANHIPLVFHLPGSEPRTIPETVRIIDIAPTLADLAGAPKPPEWEGRSFAPWLHATEEPEWRPFYGETGFPFIQFRVEGIERPALPPMDGMTRIDEDFNYQFVLQDRYRQALVDAKQRCLRTRHWKLVCTPTATGERHYQLFHLDADPHAEHDLAATRPEILEPMRRALDLWIDVHRESPISAIFPNGEPAE
jgi:arylsulfatase A-like enzyme